MEKNPWDKVERQFLITRLYLELIRAHFLEAALRYQDLIDQAKKMVEESEKIHGQVSV